MYVLKSEISPHDKFFFTYIFWWYRRQISGMYVIWVWLYVSVLTVSSLILPIFGLAIFSQVRLFSNIFSRSEPYFSSKADVCYTLQAGSFPMLSFPTKANWENSQIISSSSNESLPFTGLVLPDKLKPQKLVNGIKTDSPTKQWLLIIIGGKGYCEDSEVRETSHSVEWCTWELLDGSTIGGRPVLKNKEGTEDKGGASVELIFFLGERGYEGQPAN